MDSRMGRIMDIPFGAGYLHSISVLYRPGVPARPKKKAGPFPWHLDTLTFRLLFVNFGDGSRF